MLRLTLITCIIVLSFRTEVTAQQTRTTLQEFFQRRLTNKPDATPPSYNELLKVIDSIAVSSASDIEAALPSIFDALNSKINNLSVEGAFALYSISQRPDGGDLLKSRISQIGNLLASPDDRLSGGAVVALKNLTRSIPDATIPLLLQHLSGPGKPSLVKADIISTLLESRPVDAKVRNAIASYLNVDAEPKIRVANLQVIAMRHVSTPAIRAYTLSSLDSSSSYVKIAAIHAAHALGDETWNQALPTVSKLATSPAESNDVKSAAEKELQGNVNATPR